MRSGREEIRIRIIKDEEAEGSWCLWVNGLSDRFYLGISYLSRTASKWTTRWQNISPRANQRLVAWERWSLGPREGANDHLSTSIQIPTTRERLRTKSRSWTLAFSPTCAPRAMMYFLRRFTSHGPWAQLPPQGSLPCLLVLLPPQSYRLKVNYSSHPNRLRN